MIRRLVQAVTFCLLWSIASVDLFSQERLAPEKSLEKSLTLVHGLEAELKAHPDESRLKYLLGQAYGILGLHYLGAGRYKEAIIVLQKSLDTGNPPVEVYRDIGVAYMGLGMLPEATKAYEKAIREVPSAENYSDLGALYGRQGDYDRALKVYTQAIGINQNIAGIYYNRGGLFAKRKDYDRALSDYVKAVELNPEFSSAPAVGRWADMSTQLGDKYFEEHKYEDASRHYSNLILLQPRNSEAFLKRGKARLRLGDQEGGIADIRNAARLGNISAQELLRGKSVRW
jgi:tetratricopeptide (TPR) repeat protein